MDIEKMRRDLLCRGAAELLPTITITEQIRKALAGAAFHADVTSRQFPASRRTSRSTAPVKTPNPRRVSHY